jgi:hypothetical protein
MTEEIDRTKEWTANGMRFGYRQHVSPWGGGIVWATVNLDTGEVVATENTYFADDEHFAVSASCTPHTLVVPDNALAEDATPLMEMGEAIRKHGLPEIDRSPSAFWQNHVKGEPQEGGGQD